MHFLVLALRNIFVNYMEIVIDLLHFVTPFYQFLIIYFTFFDKIFIQKVAYIFFLHFLIPDPVNLKCTVSTTNYHELQINKTDMS